MAKIRRLTTHFFVAYHIKGEKISAARVNPLVAQFIDMFMDFKIEKQNYKAVVSRCTDSVFEKVDTRLVKASSHLTFEIFDGEESADVNLYGLNHGRGAQIHQGLRKLSLVDGKYSNRIDIVVKDTVQASEPPMSHENSPWPSKRW